MKDGYDQFFKQAKKNAGIPVDTPVKPKRSSPEMAQAKQTAMELRERMRPRIEKKKRKSIPWKLVGGSFIGLAIAGVGFSYSEHIENYFKKVEISILGTASAQETKPVKKEESKAVEKTEASEKTDTAKKEFSTDEINHFSKLNERKKELDAREEELNRAESELATQKADLEKKLAELEQTRRHIASVLEEKVKVDEQKVDTLVQLYSNMKPQQAAKVFEAMDEDLAVEILGKMKKKNAAEIMNLVKAEKAQLFSEKYAGYKRK